MVNYQLYHTNVWLGGQMKYDLILDSAGQDLVISDFHLSPISESIVYNKYVKDNLLHNSHQDNIRNFYKKISGQFFNNIGKPELSGLQPIISNETSLDTHDDTYEMGCRRSSYNLYKKQFEFLVPLWLEYIPQDSFLNFQFDVYTKDDDNARICSKNLILKDIPDYSFHNNFVQYLNNYFKYIGVQDGISDVINIDPIENIATVSGLNVENGLHQIKNLYNLDENLFSRELPLLEFDNLIISSLKDNQLISRQLYNFNLCFNLEDILTNYIFNLFKGGQIYIKVKVGIQTENNGQTTVTELELKDFYTNYEMIPKKYCGVSTKLNLQSSKQPFDFKLDTNFSNNIESLNVLDYLMDYKYIQHISKNKLTQPVIHWSLVEDNDYIFNAYNGFSGFYKDENGIIHNGDRIYDDVPNILIKEPQKSLNSTTWCNSVYADTTGIIAGHNIQSRLDLDFKKYASEFGSGILTKGIKYEGYKLKLLFIYLHGYNYELDPSNFEEGVGVRIFELKEDNNIKGILIKQNNTDYYVICKDENYFTYKRFIELIESINNELGENDILYNTLSTASDRSILIYFNSSVDLVRADSPSLSSTEIDYYKNNIAGGDGVLRLFGKIRPTFISQTDDINFNYRYSKKIIQLTDYKSTEFFRYRYSNYQPVYPSIKYFAIDKVKENYMGDFGEYIEKNTLDRNRIIVLDPVIHLSAESVRYNDGTYKKLADIIYDYLGSYYGITDETYKSYIFSLYQYKASFEYASIDTIEDYIYNIEIELK